MSHQCLKFKRFCKVIFPLALFLVLSFGCDKEENPGNNPENNSIIGYWDWYLSIEPYPFVLKTPLTEGYEAAIKFEPSDSVKYFKNDTLITTYPYDLKYRINNFLDPNSDSTLVVVINGGTETFFSILNDTLILDQTYVDGPRDYYKRKK